MTDAAPVRRVAWVTGASRGVGRGVAVALGQAGWVVYVTARSSGTGRTVPGRCPVRPPAEDRAVTYTIQPACPRATATPRPTPRLAPVTQATRRGGAPSASAMRPP